MSDSTHRWRKHRRLNPRRSAFTAKRGMARRAGIEFTLEFDDVEWPTHCPVLGMPLVHYAGHTGRKGPRDDSYSFDRVDPQEGYTPSNTLIVSQLANRIKSNAAPEVLRKVADFYSNHHPGEHT